MTEEKKKKTVARKKKMKKEENTGVLGVMNNYAGQYVSLNMKLTTYFGIGMLDNGMQKFCLNPNNWCDIIPQNLTDPEVDSLTKAIYRGELVLGKEWIPVLDKDSQVKKDYVSLLRQYRACTEDFKDHLRALVLKKNDGNYTAKELVRAMLTAEKDGNSRPEFLSFLQSAEAHCTGPVSLVEDFPNDPENFSVTIDPASKNVVSTTKKGAGKEIKSVTPDDPEVRASKIESAFG